MALETLFADMEALYARNGLTFSTRPPLNLAVIQAFEAKENLRLPPDLVEFFTRTDGSGSQRWACATRKAPMQILSFQECVKLFDQNWPCGTIQMAVPDCGRITPRAATSARVKWLPFADFNGTTTAICDLEPGSKGVVGQVVIYRMPDSVEVVADSFEEFMRQSVAELSSDFSRALLFMGTLDRPPLPPSGPK